MARTRTYRIKQYPLEAGALEIQYIEEFFGEFDRKKTADEIQRRLRERPHCIFMAESQLSDEPSQMIPVSYKVAHEIFADEKEPKLRDLVHRLSDAVDFNGRRILYSWIGATRSDWRGQGHFRALTEQQEAWALEHGFKEVVVKTKNKFYGMRGTLTHLNFDVIKYERNPLDNRESKVYVSKRIGPEILQSHLSERKVVQAIGGR
jgi:GNAT superfamily N-acetyltransferase